MKTRTALMFLVLLPMLSWSCKDDEAGKEGASQENAYRFCCQRADVEFDMGGAKIYIPNIFTPNGDGINDLFMPFTGPGIEEIIDVEISEQSAGVLFFKENISPNDVSNAWGNNEEINHRGYFNYTFRFRNTAGEIGAFAGSACVYICKTETDSLPLENIANCRFGTQHDENGGHDPLAPSLEPSQCF